MEFYDQDFANSRLSHSIIRIDGNPVFILEVGGRRPNFALRYIMLDRVFVGGEDPHIIKISDSSIDFTPVPLGFGFARDSTVNFSRIPRRSWKIGLSKNNLNIFSVAIQDHVVRVQTPCPFNLQTVSQELADTIKSKYPTLDYAIRVAALKRTISPFSRNFAVASKTKETKLIHRFLGDVGVIEDDKPVLKDEFQFLIESLDEDCHAC